MIAAYAVILVGGLLITRRLDLLAAAATFWITLAAGVGLLAASGHCMVARWAFAPVCGFDFWRVIVTSPEVLIFLFFMITDPKTVPAGRVGRVVFGLLVAVASTLLMAPQTNEFGTKVALLGGLAVVCAVARSSTGSSRAAIDGRRARPVRPPAPAVGRSGRRRPAAWCGSALSVAAVAASAVGDRGRRRPGSRGRRSATAATSLGPCAARRRPGDASRRSPSSRTSSTGTTRSPAPGAQELVLTLAENLQLENQALLRGDASILDAVDHGDRLDEMQSPARRTATASGTHRRRPATSSTTSTSPCSCPSAGRTGLSLGLESRGTVTTETYDAGRARAGANVAPFADDVRRPPGRPAGAGSTSPCCR